MVKLNDILKDIEITAQKGDLVGEVSTVAFDSRKAQAGSLFVAVRGTQADGHRFIDQACEAGAVAVLCEEMPRKLRNDVHYLQCRDTARALGMAASNFFDRPSQKLKLLGITGTNGKTTTATLLYRLIEVLGYKCGLLSTIENRVHDRVHEATLTTPDPMELNRLLAEMVAEGCQYCVMEVSSHAAHQKRIAGLEFRMGMFSNITHDHLDYHKEFSHYLKAKQSFFDHLPEDAMALTNVDDRNGMIMVQNSRAAVKTYSLKRMADYKARVLESHLDGMLLLMDGHEVWTRFIGHFNAYNLLVVYSAASLLGFSQMEALAALSAMKPVPGRFEHVEMKEGRTGIVDYAHTPDALKNVLDTINEIRQGSVGLITVVGAGGDRDKTKRPLMAKVAARLSDKVVLTSDNPRSEEPDEIIRQMYEGLDPVEAAKVVKITDRREAIRTAVFASQPGDIILVAGKGHETYQEVKGKRSPFDDKEILMQL